MTAHALDDEDAGQPVAPAARKKVSGKKLILLVVLPVLLLVGGGAGIYFSGLLDGLIGAGAAEDEAGPAEASGPGAFYEIPELLVNLNSANARRQNFLKMSISLELEKATDIPALEQVMPRIVDNFQIYLRELRIDDLRGSAGIYRLREELLLRVSQAAHPIKVRDVLFREMLVQ